MDEVVLTSTPRTIHLVDQPMLTMGDGVMTLCKRRGLAKTPDPWTWRHCTACRKKAKESSV